MNADEMLATAILALREIANPLEFMVNRLGPDERLDGECAYRLSNDPFYLKRIATDALAKIAEPEEG